MTESDDPSEIRWVREGEILRCPWHGWEFDMLTGRTIFKSKMRVKTYDVHVEAIVDEPAIKGVETYPVTVEDELVILEY
jgi:nitrite reductase/ring-hydroxylating ferredoxin subunit